MTERSVGGVGVLDKAVAILDALAGGPVSLAELSAATTIPKPTVHRLCAALEHHGLIERAADDKRRVGPRIEQWLTLGRPRRLALVQAAEPVLQTLRDETGESVQLFVTEGTQRRCVAGLESLHGLRTIVEVGALLPLEAGSAGAVLRGVKSVRHGWVETVEERERGVVSVSAPVNVRGEVHAAISVSGPADRLGRSPGRKYGAAVVTAASALEHALHFVGD